MNIETAAVISSSTLALAAIIWSGVEGWQRRTHESRQADLDNVRDVLDQAAVALHHVAYDLDEVRSYFTTHGPMGFAHSDDGTRIYKALGEHGRELDALYERLSIRLGRDHPAVSQFKGAVEAVLDIARAVGLLRLEDRGDGGPAARHAIHQFEEQTIDRVTQSRATFDTAREQFVAEANRVAGSRLPA